MFKVCPILVVNFVKLKSSLSFKPFINIFQYGEAALFGTPIRHVDFIANFTFIIIKILLFT